MLSSLSHRNSVKHAPYIPLPVSAGANVVALLHFNGDYTDESLSSTVSHQYTSISAVNKFGTGALDCATAEVPALDLYKAGNFNLSGDFCIRMWVYKVGTGVGAAGLFFTGQSPFEQITTPNLRLILDSANAQIRTGSTNIAFNTTLNIDGSWNFVEFSRTSGVIYFFIGGILQRAITSTLDYSAPYIHLGYHYTYKFNGYVDEFLINTGVGGNVGTVVGQQYYNAPTGPFVLTSN